MIAAPKHGFVFLAAAKSGSTSIERAFGRVGQLVTHAPPTMKHASAPEFEERFAPLLAAYGFARESYETVALIREPVDLLASWWRYRARPGVPAHRSTADLSFEQFVEQVVAGRAEFRKPETWLCDESGRLLVDRLYRYEHLDRAVAWMAERAGIEADIPRLNTSTPRDLDITARARALVDEHFARERDLHAAAR